MREREVEKYLTRQVKQIGGECFKWSGPGDRGKPDRMIFMPNGRAVFVECKAPGKRATKLQQHWLKKLRGLGFRAVVVDSVGSVDELIEELSDEG